MEGSKEGSNRFLEMSATDFVELALREKLAKVKSKK